MNQKIQILPEFAIKIIAMFTMSLSHIGTFLMRYYGSNSVGYTAGLICYCIGRIAFPLYVLMTAEALRHTHSRKDYLLLIAIFWALVSGSEYIAYLIDGNLLSGVYGNAFTDLLCMVSFIYFLEHPKKWLKVFAFIPLAYVVISYAADLSEIYADTYQMTSKWSIYFLPFLRSNYSIYGFLMFLAVYYAKPFASRILKLVAGNMQLENEESMKEFYEGKPYQNLLNALEFSGILLVTLLFWGLSYTAIPDPYNMGIQTYCLFAGVFIAMYNGKRGYNHKWFKYSSYLYYPVHIILIWLTFRLIFGY